MLKFPLFLVLIVSFFCSCNESFERIGSQSIDWKTRVVEESKIDSTISGRTYLSTYSEIYTFSENNFRTLTTTVSLRNINKTDSVFIHNIEYYNTRGVKVKSYLDKTIFIKPMETVEIVIAQMDNMGGTGANFVFDWYIKPKSNEPLFEGVMVSLTGTQAFAFVTRGIRIN